MVPDLNFVEDNAEFHQDSIKLPTTSNLQTNSMHEYNAKKLAALEVKDDDEK